jgi:hypothetical protein
MKSCSEGTCTELRQYEAEGRHMPDMERTWLTAWRRREIVTVGGGKGKEDRWPEQWQLRRREEV